MSERTYLIENKFSGERRRIPAGLVKDYSNASEPYTGKRMYRFLDDIDGALKLDDGTIKPYTIPKDRIHEVAGDFSPFVLPYEGIDKDFKSSERQRILQAKADQTSAMDQIVRSAASGLTFGGSTALADWVHGDEWAQTREMALHDRPFSHFAGRAVSLIALGALPIPGLGKAAGAVIPRLKGAANTGTLFELGAAVSETAAKSITGKTIASEFWRRFGGSMSYASVVELPLSFAMASADIVDNNRDYTGEAVSSEFFSYYLMSLGLAGAMSVPFAGIAALSRRGARGVVQAADDALALPEGEASKSLLQGASRWFGRKFLRGKTPLGDAAEVELYKMTRRAGKPGAATGSRFARWAMGDDGVDFVRYHQTKLQAIQAIDAAESHAAVREAVDVLMFNTKDQHLISKLLEVKDNAELMVAARPKAADLINDARRLAETASNIVWKHPKAAKPKGKLNVKEILDTALAKSMVDPPSLEGLGYPAQLDVAINARMKLPLSQRGHLTEAIHKTFPNMEKFKYFEQMDAIDEAATSIKRMVKEFGTDEKAVRSAWNLIGPKRSEAITNPNSLRAKIKKLEGSWREMTQPKVNAIQDVEPFFSGQRPLFIRKGKEIHSGIDTRLEDLTPGINALGSANAARNQLMANASPLFRGAKPTTQVERLASQVETVMDVKKRIKTTLMYVGLKGGALRHTVTFGGVYAFRNLSTMADKRAEFAAYREMISRRASSPEAMQEFVGNALANIAADDFYLATSIAGTQVAGLSYLHTQMPRSQDPMIDSGDFSGAEIDNFLEAVGAITDPISVLATASDGSTTRQAVDALRNVYPELYIDMMLDVAEFVDEYGDQLGHAQLIGLDTFMGGALGYSDGPAPNLTYQPPYYQTTGQAASVGAIGGPEHRRMDLRMNQTPAQKVGSM